ncbi:MAG: GMP synthase [Candidatus Bathyarchaeota archaeon]|nr:MAG: GMP synthase [Candidatus Bathyarchaeota archaeon]
MQDFNSHDFVEKQIAEIRKQVGNERALVAISGGVDSTTSAVLTHKAIGGNLICVMLDDAFMRIGEAQHIRDLVSQDPIKLPIKILSVQERFLTALRGLQDAEEKRKAFRETFYTVLGETAKHEGCKMLVQGTIKADVVETTGGVKTQHNVLEQMGINTIGRYGFEVVEPLKTLYKEQVRIVARYIGIPTEIAERQPFPGPGLSVRVVGKIKRDELDLAKKATVIVEKNFKEHNPSQYFAAIFDDKTKPYLKSPRIQKIAADHFKVLPSQVTLKFFEAKATGTIAGERRYGGIAALKVQTKEGHLHKPQIPNLVALQAKVIAEEPIFTRILYAINDRCQTQLYVVVLRAIQTHDFLTAKVAEIPWTTLDETADKILETCPNVSSVYYDVTPKPPATIEME